MLNNTQHTFEASQRPLKGLFYKPKSPYCCLKMGKGYATVMDNLSGKKPSFALLGVLHSHIPAVLKGILCTPFSALSRQEKEIEARGNVLREYTKALWLISK